jgi:hypothetical protein
MSRESYKAIERTEWVECPAGCEDGYFDGYEEDPLWYDEGDLVPCPVCGGQGGYYWCELTVPLPRELHAAARAREFFKLRCCCVLMTDLDLLFRWCEL